MKIWVIRHGEKEKGDYYNSFLHHQDQPLSTTGRQQAQKLSAYFETVMINEILVSQFQRTQQTAEPIAMGKHMVPIIDARLNEIDNGVLDTMTEEQIQTAYPEFWEAFNSHNKDVRFPEGEIGEEVKKRQDCLFEDLIQKNQNTLLVSHEGFMRLLICNLMGLPLYQRHRFSIDLCGIIELEYEPLKRFWKVIRVNAKV